MAKQFYAKSGLISTKARIGGFDINRMVKSILQTFKIPVIDACCDDTERLIAVYPQVAQDNIAAAAGGAISVTNYLTTINTDAGGDTFTLADGSVIGQMKKILLVVDGGGNAVITPANLAAGTTITMNDAADFVILQWNGTEWVVIENSGSTVA
jgi:hypothetical protein